MTTPRFSNFAPSGRGPGDGTGSMAAGRRRVNWTRVLAYGVLPGLMLVLAMSAGVLRWRDSSIEGTDLARLESVRAARDSTVALLSFRPGTVERDVQAARDLLTGGFRENYTQVSRDVLIPDARRQHISATATVPEAAAVSATPDHAVVLAFVDQTVTIGASSPAATASSVRVTLDKVAGRWLVSGFDPV